MKRTVNIMPCLDMRAGRVVKGIHFADLVDAGDPVECAMAYEADGADELGFLDIAATGENRPTAFDVLRRVTSAVKIPVTLKTRLGWDHSSPERREDRYGLFRDDHH